MMKTTSIRIGRPPKTGPPLKNLNLKIEPSLKARFQGLAIARQWSLPKTLTELLDKWEGAQ